MAVFCPTEYLHLCSVSVCFWRQSHVASSKTSLSPDTSSISITAGAHPASLFFACLSSLLGELLPSAVPCLGMDRTTWRAPVALCCCRVPMAVPQGRQVSHYVISQLLTVPCFRQHGWKGYDKLPFAFRPHHGILNLIAVVPYIQISRVSAAMPKPKSRIRFLRLLHRFSFLAAGL